VVADNIGRFILGGYYLSAVIHTTLAGIEPTTFRLLVRRATRMNDLDLCLAVHANHYVTFAVEYLENRYRDRGFVPKDRQ